VRKAFNVVLGTGLVHFNPPKHHLRALGILDVVLEADKDNIVALMGRGYVMQSAKRWEDARELFGRVAALRPDDLAEGIRAKEEEAWAEVHLENLDIAEGALRSILETLDGTEERGEDKARCSYRLGRCLWARGSSFIGLCDILGYSHHFTGDSLEEAFKCFITALKRAPTFAPAFTSLGVYYAERANPPDPARASKCFQKAFELDPREADAARRLAEGFAEEREWDLVDVVARRTIEGEGGAEATGVAASRYLPTNAWAWKAVGAVELVCALPFTGFRNLLSTASPTLRASD
jgi:superkiller protein 3